jgi:hypothetical protein
MKFRKYVKSEDIPMPIQPSFGKMIIINENASKISNEDLAFMEQRMSFEADRMVDRLTKEMMGTL